MKINDDIWKHVEKCVETLETSKTNFENALDLIQVCPESVLYQSYNAVENAVVESLDRLIENSDDWIAWYVFENDFGKSELSCGKDTECRDVRDLTDLRWVIEL